MVNGPVFRGLFISFSVTTFRYYEEMSAIHMLRVIVQCFRFGKTYSQVNMFLNNLRKISNVVYGVVYSAIEDRTIDARLNGIDRSPPTNTIFLADNRLLIQHFFKESPPHLYVNNVLRTRLWSTYCVFFQTPCALDFRGVCEHMSR